MARQPAKVIARLYGHGGCMPLSRVLLRRAERADGDERRGLLLRHVRGPGRVLEPARRERHADSAFSIGVSTHHGTVTAASDWAAEAERKRVRPIYRPETERISRYFDARVSEQFDAMIHLGATRAVEPLERTAGWERGELPETFPHAV